MQRAARQRRAEQSGHHDQPQIDSRLAGIVTGVLQ
jgi:hypothetical protein